MTADRETVLREVLAAHDDVTFDLTTPREFTEYGGWLRHCACGRPLPDGGAPDEVFSDTATAHVARALAEALDAAEVSPAEDRCQACREGVPAELAPCTCPSRRPAAPGGELVEAYAVELGVHDRYPRVGGLACHGCDWQSWASDLTYEQHVARALLDTATSGAGGDAG